MHLASSAVQADATCPGPVSRAAARAGMSREGCSRRFARHHGMPPHAFSLMTRLNHARERLRAGEDIATVAAEAASSTPVASGGGSGVPLAPLGLPLGVATVTNRAGPGDDKPLDLRQTRADAAPLEVRRPGDFAFPRR